MIWKWVKNTRLCLKGCWGMCEDVMTVPQRLLERKKERKKESGEMKSFMQAPRV